MGEKEKKEINWEELRQRKLEHRSEYYDRLKNINTNNYKNLNTILIFRFICNLQNWGIYKKYDAESFYYWFVKNRSDFVERLNQYLEDDLNKQAVKIAMNTIMKQIEATNTIEQKYFYSEFLDDFEMVLGFKVKEQFNNFIPPSVFSKEAEQETAIFLYKLELENLCKLKRS